MLIISRVNNHEIEACPTIHTVMPTICIVFLFVDVIQWYTVEKFKRRP